MQKLKIQPLADRVLVQADIAEEKTNGGIFIPDIAKESPRRGTVLAWVQGILSTTKQSSNSLKQEANLDRIALRRPAHLRLLLS